MKKLLLLFALIVGFAACNETKDENPAPAPAEELLFSGHLEATPDEGSRFEAFQEEEIPMELTPGENGCINLIMPEIKFVEQMPWLAIEVRDLENTATGEDIRFEADETIPYFMGAPYDAFPISNLKGHYDAAAKSLTVDFDCNTMHVSYRGNI